MFLLVSVRHVGAHPDELQHGVSIQSSINLGKTFLRISRIRIIPSTQILARVFVYLPPFISKILDFICPMVLIFILIHFEWRDTENQQYLHFHCFQGYGHCYVTIPIPYCFPSQSQTIFEISVVDRPVFDPNCQLTFLACVFCFFPLQVM